MKRVTLSVSFDVEDEERFLEQADEMCVLNWGDTLREISDEDTPLLVSAAFEIFVGSNGEPWPDGVADEANCFYEGSVE